MDKITNEEILNKIGEKRQLISVLRNRKKKWIGHVLRGEGLLREVLCLVPSTHSTLVLKYCTLQWCYQDLFSQDQDETKTSAYKTETTKTSAYKTETSVSRTKTMFKISPFPQDHFKTCCQSNMGIKTDRSS